MHQLNHTLVTVLLAATLFSLAKAAEHVVNIEKFAFNPPSVTVAVGDTIRWVNKDAVGHTSTSDTAGLWDSGLLAQGKDWSKPFTTAATYQYHCKPHPYMKGTVIVQKAQGGGGGGVTMPSVTSGSPTSGNSSMPSPTSSMPSGSGTMPSGSSAIVPRADLSVAALMVILAFVQQLV